LRHTRSYELAVSIKPFPNRTGVFQRIRLSVTSELSSRILNTSRFTESISSPKYS